MPFLTKVAVPSFLLLSGCRSSHATPPAERSVPTASAVVSATPAPVAIPLYVAATSPDALALHEAVGQTFVHAGGFFASIESGAIHQDPSLLLGLDGFGEVARVEGEWPDAAYLTLLITPKLTPWTSVRKVYRWYQSHWSAASSPLHDTPPLGLAAWGDRTLALFLDETGTLRFHLARAMKDTSLPILPTSQEPGCAYPLRTKNLSLLGFRTGELILLGEACGKPNEGAPAALSWAPGSLEAKLTMLPKGASDVIAPLATARAANDIHVAGRSGNQGYLARFDGTSWSLEDAPPIGPLVALSEGADRSLWIASRTSVQRRADGGSFAAASRADGSAIDGVTTLVASSFDHAFVSLTNVDGSELLSTDKTAAPLVIPDKKTFWETRSATGRAPATTACRDLFAQLSAVGKHNGYIPGDMPFLHETLRDHPDLAGARYVLDDDGVTITLGAIAPSIEVGEKILALFAPRLGLASTRVSCHAPHILVTLPQP